MQLWHAMPLSCMDTYLVTPPERIASARIPGQKGPRLLGAGVVRANAMPTLLLLTVAVVSFFAIVSVAAASPALTGAVSVRQDEVDTRSCSGEAQFQAQLQFNWTPVRDSAFPATELVGFSELVCVTHSDQYAGIWEEGKLASDEVAALVSRTEAQGTSSEQADDEDEDGDTVSSTDGGQSQKKATPFTALVQSLVRLKQDDSSGIHEVIVVFSDSAPAVSGEVALEDVDAVEPETTDDDAATEEMSDSAPRIQATALVGLPINVSGDSGHTLLSCISAIRPSPDFFVGVSSIPLCANGKFGNDSIPVKGYDAGTDDGTAYVGTPEPVPDDPGRRPIKELTAFAPRYGTLNVSEMTAEETTVSDSEPEVVEGSASNVACFPADEVIEVMDRGLVHMRDLRIGDRVAVAGNASSSTSWVSSSTRSFSEVFAFSHADETAVARFVHIYTAATSVRLSPGHYLYIYQRADAHDDNCAADVRLVAADEVRVGDALVAADGTPLPVIRVGETRAFGLYNPHTVSGELVVAGVRVSCYTRAVPPSVAHALLSPLRVLYALGLAAPSRAVGAALQGPTGAARSVIAAVEHLGRTISSAA